MEKIRCRSADQWSAETTFLVATVALVDRFCRHSRDLCLRLLLS